MAVGGPERGRRVVGPTRTKVSEPLQLTSVVLPLRLLPSILSGPAWRSHTPSLSPFTLEMPQPGQCPSPVGGGLPEWPRIISVPENMGVVVSLTALERLQ